MPTAPVLTTGQCDWSSGDNLTEPRVTEQLDYAGCLFLSILPHGQAVTMLVWIFVLLTLSSFLVNGFTLFGLGRSEDLSWEPRVALFKNLIVSDLLQTITFGPAVIHSLVQRRTMAFSTWCNVQYFVGTVSIFSVLLTITCMAFERYLYVCHAIHYLVILTQTRRRLALALIWVYSISVGTVNLMLLHKGTGQKNEQATRGLLCEPDMVEQYMGFPRASAVFRKLMGSVTLLVCLLVYAFSYLRMYQDARNAMMPFNTVNTTARKTVSFYCGMLLLQLLPLLLKVASDALWEVEGTAAMVSLLEPTPSDTAVVLHMSLLVMLLVPPFINPVVYGLRNAEMRKAMLGRLGIRTGRRGAEEMRLEYIVPQNRAQ
ncbi:olfactory receptor 14I1 [Anoplopoma fimbria]|uniref:olfactory receptor 14I1 n=1 Tax=Anoplopoma fimbria TaxID=229290 RepID=UPI0023EB8C1F|nr:olfactory receptor 14I1 [Anoplopoma fimbria]